VWETKLDPRLRQFLRAQPTLVFIGVLIYALFSALKLNVPLPFLIINILTIGNCIHLVQAFCAPLYENRSFPWNWLILLLVLASCTLMAVLASALLLKWMVETNQPFGAIFREIWGINAVVCVGAGVIGFAVDQVQRKLREKNLQLEQAVAKGSAIIEQQEEELVRAHEIQRDLLPKILPALRAVELASAWQPARAVGGDYFDVIRLDEKRLGICIGDVSGKGLTAALLMANLQAAFHAFATPDASPARVCAKLNEFVSGNVAPGKFITFFYGILDGDLRSFRYENAGHCPTLLVRASGKTEFLQGHGAVLGVIPEWEYKDSDVQLGPGDRLLFYTDGVTEAENQEFEEFGAMRLAQAATSDVSSAADTQKNIMKQVGDFCSQQFRDDVSLIVAALR
jgi:sigma-B regulation protein RsbU (phosphoserine phosphatase)